jgi:hypothetical protein
VVVDRVVVPKLFGFMEGQLQAADQQVLCLKQLNQSLKNEVAKLNEHAFCYRFEAESDGGENEQAAAAAVTGGGGVGVGVVGGGGGGGAAAAAGPGSKSGSVFDGSGGSTTTVEKKKKERPVRKCRTKHHPYYTSISGRKGKSSSSSADKKTHRSKGRKEQKDAPDSSPRKKLRIRVMHKEGPAFQVMVEQRMLETYPEMVIYPDAPKVVFKDGL